MKVIRLVRNEASAAKLTRCCQGPPFSRRNLRPGRTAPGPPPRAPRSTSRSTASAGVCWAKSRICWLKGPGPSSISAHSAGRRATSVYFRPGPSRSKAWRSAAGCGSHRISGEPYCARTAARAGGRTLFEVAERYLPSRIADAVTHASQASRAGVVLIDFSQH